MKDNLTHILEAFENNPSLSDRFDSAPLFNDVFTNMPELKNFRLTFNLFYRQLYLDSASAEDFFNRIVFYNRFPEDIAELVDSIEKFHPPIKVENEFFAFQDFFDILITQSRYLENLNVRSLALEAKSILSSERILTGDIPAKKLPPITLEEEQFFAAIGDIEFELLRATIFTSFVNARESELVSKAFQFFDRSRISDDEIKKLFNVNTEEEQLSVVDDYIDILYGFVMSGGAGGSTDKINVRDSFLSAAPLLTLDKISNSDLRLLEVRLGFISEIIDSLDEQKNFFGTSLFELERLKDTSLETKSFISSDKFFTDIFSQNFYGIAFTEAENEERKEELLELSAGGEGVRRTGEVTEDDYSLVKFFVELSSLQEFNFLKDFFLTPAVPLITKDSALFISGIDNFFIDKNPRDLVSISALRKDVFFFFELAGIFESFQIKDFFIANNGDSLFKKDNVDINDTSIVKAPKISKTYPQFFHPKGSNLGQFRSKIGIYHPFYSPQDNPVQITGDVYREAPAPWEDFVQIGSDGSGAGYRESISAPRRYTWRVTPNQSDITRGSWVWFGGRWPVENIPGKRRTNFLMRSPIAGTGLYNRFTGPAYIEYGQTWLKNAGIFEVHSKKSFENILSAYSHPGSISKSFSSLNDRFYIGEEEVDPFILPFYTENINVLNPPRKKFITDLDDQFAYNKDSVAVIANDYEILRDLFYSDELLLDFLIGKNPSEKVTVVQDITKQPIYDFNESLYLKSIFTYANEGTIAKDRFYGTDLFDPIKIFPKKSERVTLSQSNHRLINNLSPETSFILSGLNKLSTKVNFIRNEISQDSTNVETLTVKVLPTTAANIPIYEYGNFSENVIYKDVSIPINIQNLLLGTALVKSYSISSINITGPNQVFLRVKDKNENYQQYTSGINQWKTSDIYSLSTLEIEAQIPYAKIFSNTYERTINDLSVEVTLDLTFTGGDIEFTGDPSEFPFVNNIQSADPGSAFINIYCPGYFLELYVGEEGTYATF